MFNPELKVIDCTIRDGGLMNKWQFPHELVRRVYQANILAGVDIMEIGYKASPTLFDPKEYGPWRFTNEEDLEKITQDIENPHMKLAMMVDIGRCSEKDIPPKTQSKIDIIRVACYAKEIDAAIALTNHCIEKGYETFINIMAISTNSEPLLDQCLQQVEEETQAKGIVVVDSFGSLDLDDIKHLVTKYQTICPTKVIGFHGHNNQQMAYANTTLAASLGVTYLDATYYGIGRGAGNCPIELLLSYLKNPKFDIAPILKVIDDDFMPLMDLYKWGYRVPYAITGILNQHPRSAMAYMDDAKGESYLHYYNRLCQEDIV